MKLTNPTDDQLNAAFAEKVAGIPGLAPFYAMPYSDKMTTLPRFTQSANAVLPWLEKCRQGYWRCDYRGLADDNEQYRVTISGTQNFEALAHAFSRAATIALLRSHGIEVEFT